MQGASQGHEEREKDRRRRELAMIHIIAKHFEWTNAEYRKFMLMYSQGRTFSSADFTAEERRVFINAAKRAGWKPVHKSARKSGMHNAPPEEKAPLLSKIEAILADLGLPWSYADGMAQKMFKVRFVRWLDYGQTRKLTSALIYHQRRQYARNGEVLPMARAAKGASGPEKRQEAL